MMNLLKSLSLLLGLSLVLTSSLSSQVYEDYLGAGQNVGVTVSGSPFSSPDTSLHSISGTTLMPDLAGASRFLSQATLGANYEEIENVSTIGIKAWMDNQFALPHSSYMDRYDEIYAATQTIISNPGHSNQYSSDGVLSGETDALMTYHDILYHNAFGNYRDIIEEITYSAAMGKYLSHFQNQRADFIGQTFPDENFAREIMQLFSIGLEKLNIDGTVQKDASGNVIPTYDIEDVEGMAKVFTGLAAKFQADGTLNDNFHNANLDHREGLAMFEDFHSIGSKEIFSDIVIPAGQVGDVDIQQTLDAVFNHENVGPFLGMRLIQHLVKSNPSPAYVKRVALVFNNNGQGVRGDLKAVIEAILLDPEARDCEVLNDLDSGKLIQPIERFTTLFKAFDVSSPSDTLWLFDFEDYGLKLFQSFQNSPTVFNFFSPFYAEESIIAVEGLYSPEFQILDAISSIRYLNEMETALKVTPFTNRTAASADGLSMANNENDVPVLDFSDEITIYQTDGIEALLERLDILICRGQLSQEVKDIISNTISQNIANVNDYDDYDALYDILYFIFLSPDYMILR